LTEARPAIVLERVDKSYAGSAAYVVRDFSLSITRGEFFCLIGPSGCGKSTVIKMIAGIEPPTSGAVTRPERIGMVFQSYALLPWLTVEANVAFAARMAGFAAKKVETLTRRYLKMVRLEDFAKRYPRELSGGQRERVGLARALAVEPDVLLMDEPFSALDPVMVDQLHADVLRIWAETGKTVVMVSHNFEEAVFLADRIRIIRDGRLEKVVQVDLPRPRNEGDPAFATQVRQLRAYLAEHPTKARHRP